MDDAAAAYDIALISQYAYLQTVPNYCAHLTAGFYPDAAIYAIKAQREGAIVEPMVQTGVVAK